MIRAFSIWIQTQVVLILTVLIMVNILHKDSVNFFLICLVVASILYSLIEKPLVKMVDYLAVQTLAICKYCFSKFK